MCCDLCACVVSHLDCAPGCFPPLHPHSLSQGGATALFIAAQEGQLECLEALIKAKTSLDLQSQLGVGTTATVRLPAARTAPLETLPAAAAS